MLDKNLSSISRKLLGGMRKQDFDNIKSITGLVETSCNIVEEAYNRLDKASKSVEKKNTAIIMLRPIFQKLKEEQIIDSNIERIIAKQLETGYVESVIDDVITSWKKNLKEIKKCCFYFRKGSRFLEEHSTKLEKIIISDKPFEIKEFSSVAEL